MTYEPPTVTELGSLRELTLQNFNKIGPNPDAFSAINPNIIGTLTPRQ